MNAHQCGRSCRSSICSETKQVARVHNSCSVCVLVQSRKHLSKFQVNPIRFQVVVATRIGNTKRGVIASVSGVQTFHTCSKRPKESQNRSRERRRRPSRVPTALRQTWDRAGGGPLNAREVLLSLNCITQPRVFHRSVLLGANSTAHCC